MNFRSRPVGDRLRSRLGYFLITTMISNDQSLIGRILHARLVIARVSKSNKKRIAFPKISFVVLEIQQHAQGAACAPQVPGVPVEVGIDHQQHADDAGFPTFELFAEAERSDADGAEDESGQDIVGIDIEEFFYGVRGWWIRTANPANLTNQNQEIRTIC